MKSLSEEKKRSIAALREYGFSQASTADLLGVSRTSVRDNEPEDIDGYDEALNKVWDDIAPAFPDDIDPLDQVEEEHIPEDLRDAKYENEATDPYEDEIDQRNKVVSDPEEYSPGEFIEQFFNELEVQVKSDFVALQRRRADRKRELPDREKMLEDLTEMPSKVTGRTAEYIADEYWEAAQQYISETPTTAVGDSKAPQQQQSQRSGSFVPTNQSQQQQAGWTQMPDGSTRYGRFEPQPDGSMTFVPMQPPGGGQPPGAPQQQQQGMSPAEKEMLKEIRRLREDQSGGGGDDIMSQIQKLKEMQQAAKELGGQEQEEMMGVLQRELRALRQDMQGSQPVEPSDPKQAVLQQVMDSENVDQETALEILDRVEGQKDSEIRKKEIDKELEMKKMERKKERQQSIVESLEGVAQTVTETVAASLRDSPQGGQQQAAQQQQVAQQREQQPRPTTDGSGASQAGPTPGEEMRQWECPQCGTTTPHPPGSARKRCSECDFSRVPCPDCRSPVDIPPADQAERGGCPDCGSNVPVGQEMENASCIECGWHGEAEEVFGDTVTCENCGSEHPVMSEQT